MKQEEGTTYGYGFWYLLNVLVSIIFMDRDTSHLKDSKTIEDYQGTAPTPTALETGSDVVEEEIFGLRDGQLHAWFEKMSAFGNGENNRNPGALSPTNGCGLKRLVCFFGLA